MLTPRQHSARDNQTWCKASREAEANRAGSPPEKGVRVVPMLFAYFSFYLDFIDKLMQNWYKSSCVIIFL